MTRARALVRAALLLLASFAPASAFASEGPLEIAAMTGLALVDEGRYEDAWREAAPLLHDGTSLAQWSETTRRLREPLGRVVSREVLEKAYHTTLEGGPDGTYFTLRIRARLSGGGERIELVTLSAGSDPQYRVAVYGLKN